MLMNFGMVTTSRKHYKRNSEGYSFSCNAVAIITNKIIVFKEECNVICVDWEGGATMPNYLRAAANTRLVGKQLAMLLQGLFIFITRIQSPANPSALRSSVARKSL